MLKALESFIYRRASHISLISEGFKRNLVEKGVAPEKLSVTPLWSDQNVIFPQEKENSFKAAQGLSNQFVILCREFGIYFVVRRYSSLCEYIKRLPGNPLYACGRGSEERSFNSIRE